MVFNGYIDQSRSLISMLWSQMVKNTVSMVFLSFISIQTVNNASLCGVFNANRLSASLNFGTFRLWWISFSKSIHFQQFHSILIAYAFTYTNASNARNHCKAWFDWRQDEWAFQMDALLCWFVWYSINGKNDSFYLRALILSHTCSFRHEVRCSFYLCA